MGEAKKKKRPRRTLQERFSELLAIAEKRVSTLGEHESGLRAQHATADRKLIEARQEVVRIKEAMGAFVERTSPEDSL